MKNKVLENYILQRKKAYMNFVGISDFPQFTIVSKHMDIRDSQKKGWGAFATHYYAIETNSHRLVVWEDLWKNQSTADYLLFHEFTHILDTETHVHGSKEKYAKYRGFTEYHAGQIDMLKIANRSSTNDYSEFSAKTIVKTVGSSKSLGEYAISSIVAANELLDRDDFPVDIETLYTVLSMLFNYFGRRYICKKCAPDFVDTADLSKMRDFIGGDAFDALNRFMDFELDESKVDLLMDFFFKMFVSLMKKYGF